MDSVSEALTLRRDERGLEVPASSGLSYEPHGDDGCRSCGGALHPFIEHGPDVRVCSECWLAQRCDDVPSAGIVSGYASFSSFAEAWLAHARHYGPHAVRRFNLGAGSVVLEVAHDGLPRHVPAEPTAFSRETAFALAAQGKAADLVIGNGVLARVPDPTGFVAGLAAVLKPAGILTIDFTHLMNLVEGNLFEADHPGQFSYFSLAALDSLFTRQGLRIFDLDELATRGGSLRLFCCHAGSAHRELASVARLRAAEKKAGLCDLASYRDLGAKAAGQNARSATG